MVNIHRTVVDDEGNQRQEWIRTLRRGGYFGEMALLNAERRTATVTASESTTCASLDRVTVENLVGNLREILQAAALKRKREAATSIKTEISFFDLKVRQTIGVGSHGVVKLVVHKATERPYAMKVMRKSQVRRSDRILMTESGDE